MEKIKYTSVQYDISILVCLTTVYTGVILVVFIKIKGVKMEFQIFYEMEPNDSRSQRGFRPLPMSAFSQKVQANIIEEVGKVLKEGGEDSVNYKEME